MIPRCNNCNKFVGIDPADPEVTDEELHDDGSFGVSVTITNNCMECGTELRTASFDVEGQFERDASKERYMEVQSVESSTEYSGKGRGTQTFYGFTGEAVLYSKKGKMLESVDISDSIQASYMDEV